MLAAIPFGGSSDFCSNYVAAVRADVACSLGLPPTHVEVTADACASWGREGIEVDVCILSDDAATLSAALVAQVSDPASRIWSGTSDRRHIPSHAHSSLFEHTVGRGTSPRPCAPSVPRLG